MNLIKGKQILDNTISQNNINIQTETIINNNNVTNKEYIIQQVNERTSKIYQSRLNQNMVANIATIGEKACDYAVIEFPISSIIVMVNGLLVNVGEGLDCYFSPNGILIRDGGNAQKGDYLYWNSTKYDLNTTDEIDFNYLINYDYVTLNSGTTVTLDNNYNSMIVKYVGNSGTTMNVIISGVTFVVGNINGYFVWDIGGMYEYTFMSINSAYSFDINGYTYTVWFDGFGSLIYSVKNIKYGTFSIESGFNDITYEIMESDDKNILISGQYTTYKDTLNNGLVKVYLDGTPNILFNIGSGFTNGITRVITKQSDGKILVGGTFVMFNGLTYNKIIRLNIDGSVDDSFINGSGFSDGIRSITVQYDNKIIVGGTFTVYSGITYNKIIRLNEDGSIDDSFINGNGFNSHVYTVCIQSDNKIIVGGNFTSYSGVTSKNYIIRLNQDGTIDTTFANGSGFNNAVFIIKLQSDGKILCVGNFTSYNGVTVNRIARLNQDGTLDTTFNIGTGFNANTRYINVTTDNKILVTGLFTSYNNYLYNYIIRLNYDGSVDTTFDIGNGFNNRTYDVETQSDGKIIVSGEFTQYNGYDVNYFVRLYPNGMIDTR